MKQIKGIILFLMSIVLVAFGSQDSKNSKNLVKQLEDETKKVGDRIKDIKEEKTAKVETKKNEQKQPVQQPAPQQQPVAANSAQTQPTVVQPAPNTPAQPTQVTSSDTTNPAFALNDGGKENGKKENRKNRRNNKNIAKVPKHSRLKDTSSSSAGQEKTSKSQDSAPKSSGSGSSTGSSSGSSSSGSSSSGGGDSSSSE